MISMGQGLALELEHEGIGTRKALERAPADKFGWKPHEKSMTLGGLVSHIADVANWGLATIKDDKFEFDASYKPFVAKDTADLLAHYDKSYGQLLELLKAADDGIWMTNWKLIGNGQEIFSMPRIVVMRSFVVSHMIHHRAQLTVYLRLLDVPVPALYGPSADEKA